MLCRLIVYSRVSRCLERRRDFIAETEFAVSTM